MKVYCVVNKTKEILNIPRDAYVIGVDRGSVIALQYGVHLSLAIGDFDSVDDKELEFIKSYSDSIEIFSPQKDKTDTELAIERAKEFADEVIIYGGIEGKRIEHFVSNLCLFSKYDNLYMINNNSKIFTINKDTHISKDGYKYISIFSLEPLNVTLEGFKYPLKDYHLSTKVSLGVSNEILYDLGVVKTTGKLLVIQTNDDKIGNWLV